MTTITQLNHIKASQLLPFLLMSFLLVACGALMPTPMYSTNADLTEVIDDRVTIQLIDDERAGFTSLSEITAAAADSLHEYHAAAVAQLARIERARATGDELINTYLRTQMDVPASPVPVIINQISADMTSYFLHKRRGLNADLTGITATYKANIALLQEYREGFRGIGVADDGGAAIIRTNKQPGNRKFNFG